MGKRKVGWGGGIKSGEEMRMSTRWMMVGGGEPREGEAERRWGMKEEGRKGEGGKGKLKIEKERRGTGEGKGGWG